MSELAKSIALERDRLQRRIEELERELENAGAEHHDTMHEALAEARAYARRLVSFARQAYSHAGLASWKGDEEDSEKEVVQFTKHCAVLYYGAEALLADSPDWIKADG